MPPKKTDIGVEEKLSADDRRSGVDFTRTASEMEEISPFRKSTRERREPDRLGFSAPSLPRVPPPVKSRAKMAADPKAKTAASIRTTPTDHSPRNLQSAGNITLQNKTTIASVAKEQNHDRILGAGTEISKSQFEPEETPKKYISGSDERGTLNQQLSLALSKVSLETPQSIPRRDSQISPKATLSTNPALRFNPAQEIGPAPTGSLVAGSVGMSGTSSRKTSEVWDQSSGNHVGLASLQQARSLSFHHEVENRVSKSLSRDAVQPHQGRENVSLAVQQPNHPAMPGEFSVGADSSESSEMEESIDHAAEDPRKTIEGIDDGIEEVFKRANIIKMIQKDNNMNPEEDILVPGLKEELESFEELYGSILPKFKAVLNNRSKQTDKINRAIQDEDLRKAKLQRRQDEKTKLHEVQDAIGNVYQALKKHGVNITHGSVELL